MIKGIMGVDMIFIFLLALILFGPKRLPEIAREVGKFMAEFRRASNDFKYQLQSEIDKASANAAPPSQAGSQPGSTAAPTLLASAGSSATSPSGSEAESEHERLMRTARMAYEAQNFTLRPPEPPPVASTALQSPPAQPQEEAPPPSGQSPAAQCSLPFAPAGPAVPAPGVPASPGVESNPASPAESIAARPSASQAPEAGNSALQNS